MITVDTINPVIEYSNASGKSKSTTTAKRERLMSEYSRSEREDGRRKVREESKKADKYLENGIMTKKENRQFKRGLRKAKRNAVKLQILKSAKSGKSVFVKKMIKLRTDKNGKKTKTWPDGTVVEVPISDVVVTPQGEFDKQDIADATGLKKEQVTPEVVKQVTVATVPTSLESTTTNVATPTDSNAELSVKVPEAQVVDTGAGIYSASDTQPEGEPAKDVAQEDKDKKNPLKTWEKVLIFGSIAVVLTVIGVAIYKHSKNN